MTETKIGINWKLPVWNYLSASSNKRCSFLENSPMICAYFFAVKRDWRSNLFTPFITQIFIKNFLCPETYFLDVKSMLRL